MPTRTWSCNFVVTAVQFLDGLEDAQARADGALGVILVRDRRPEHRHHRVTDEFFHGAAMALDHLLELGMVRAEPGANVLGVGVLRGGGEADQVAEEHRDHLAFLADRSRAVWLSGAVQNGQNGNSPGTSFAQFGQVAMHRVSPKACPRGADGVDTARSPTTGPSCTLARWRCVNES